MDWSYVPGVDLTRDPVVTEVDGGTLHEWPGCRVLVPGPLGNAEPSSAMPNGCRSHHGATQDPVGAILNALWPKLAECRTAKELGAAILAAGVPKRLKFKLACLARDRLGKDWTDGTVRHWLSSKAHTEERAKRKREVNRENSRAWLTNPVNAERNRERSRTWKVDNLGYAEKNRQRTRYAARGEQLNAYQKNRLEVDPLFAMTRRLRSRLTGAVKAAGSGKTGKPP